MTTCGDPRAFLLSSIGIAALILLTVPVLSNPGLLAGEVQTLPYEGGTGEILFSAAARITSVTCSPNAGGNHYSLAIEVFEACWVPVYSIVIQEIDGMPLEAATCPIGWSAAEGIGALAVPGKIVFSTESRPIQPGTVQQGFGVVSGASNLAVRWYPADENGVLVGKITRGNLSCPTAVEPETWGLIKSIYR